MDINDIVKVHIWQLTEKDHKTINKDTDYSIIHDGIGLKKVKMRKLYEYFNQDYKAENIEKYIDGILSELGNEYNELYDSIIVSYNKYEKWINELTEKFNENSDNVRRLIKISGTLDSDINSIEEAFSNIDDKQSNLDVQFKNISIILTNQSIIITTCTEDIDNLKEIVVPMIDVINDLFESADEMSDRLDSIGDSTIQSTENKKSELIDKINEEYDKIVSIIDHYHHIHDIPYRKR